MSNAYPKTIREIHEAYDRRDFTPRALIEASLASARFDDRNAVLTVSEVPALAKAAEADALLAKEGRVPRDRFPLFGIPLGLKDILVTAGVRTTCASCMLENYIPPYTGTAVSRLEAAGAIGIAKLNCDEFAMGGSNENSAFGAVKHPTQPDRVPGGSSGGSAVAVATGICKVALGTDTGGSIRLPASYCGIVGLKPTYGRVSRYGMVAFASSLDQIGPMTSSVEDAAIMLDAMSGQDPLDSTSARRPPTATAAKLREKFNWQGVRVGVPREFALASGEGLQPAVAETTRASLKWLEAQGAKLVEISLPHARFAVAIYYIVAVCEASSNLARFDGVRFGVRPTAADASGDLAEFYRKVRAGFGAEVKRRIILGTFALSSGYADEYYRRAGQVRRLVQRDFDQAFQQVDLIAGPVAPTTAFKIGEKSANPLQMYLNDLYTIPANLAGLPAISLPAGADSTGLPIGFQLTAAPFEEELLLQAAHSFEAGHRGVS